MRRSFITGVIVPNKISKRLLPRNGVWILSLDRIHSNRAHGLTEGFQSSPGQARPALRKIGSLSHLIQEAPLWLSRVTRRNDRCSTVAVARGSIKASTVRAALAHNTESCAMWTCLEGSTSSLSYRTGTNSCKSLASVRFQCCFLIQIIENQLP